MIIIIKTKMKIINHQIITNNNNNNINTTTNHNNLNYTGIPGVLNPLYPIINILELPGESLTPSYASVGGLWDQIFLTILTHPLFMDIFGNISPEYHENNTLSKHL
eukprot:UN08704